MFGVRVWDAAGNLNVDVTHRLGRIVGTYSVNVARDVPLTINVPGFANDGTWIALMYGEMIAIETGAGFVRLTYPSGWLANGLSRSATVYIYRC